VPTEDSRAPAQEAFASPVLAATIAAAAMVAQTVIGKATRDALFLSHFPVARLPIALIAGSIVSTAVVRLTTHLLTRYGPARVLPLAFAVQGGLLLLEWALSTRFEAQVAIVFYVHMIAASAPIVSVFWSAVSEAFDPHSVRQLVGRIGAGAALGGVLGGAMAWGASRIATVPTMLGVMAVLCGVGAWGARGLVRGTRGSHVRPAATVPRTSGLTALRQTPYLRWLAILVLLGGLMQSLLDYALGAEATATYGGGARLLAFFAIFQTVIGVVSFLVQLSGNRLALDRLGVGGTMALLPGSVVALGALALGAPSLVTVALQKGTEALLRASLFRSAYEVLFTPVAPALKRPTKTLIDVSFDRMGLMAGSALTLGLIALLPRDAVRAVLFVTVVTAAIQLVVAHRLHHGYIGTLTERLRSGILVLDAASIVDATTRQTLSRTMESLDRPTLLAQIETLRARADTRAPAASEPIPEHPDVEASPSDDLVRTLADLRAPSAVTIRRGLRRPGEQLLPLALPILELLARDDVARDAALSLAPLIPRIVGTILDVVLDSGRPPSARRRAARLLGAVSSQRAALALESALDAEDLDVRYTCGRVLVSMRENSAELRFDAEAALARARRELQATSEGRARDARQLEHAFNVLSLTFPREPMQLAYGAVVALDPFLRGVALEYLDAVLPADLRAALTPRLDSSAPQKSAAPRPSARALDDLLQSKETIQLNLDEIRRVHDPDGEAPT
jgi:ATP:ADP antiporter, AAA family